MSRSSRRLPAEEAHDQRQHVRRYLVTVESSVMRLDKKKHEETLAEPHTRARQYHAGRVMKG